MTTTYEINRRDLIKVLDGDQEVDKLLDSLRVAANKRRAGHPAYQEPAEPVEPEELEVHLTDEVGAADSMGDAGAVESEQRAGEA